MKDHAVVHWKRFLNSSKLLKPSFTRRLLNLVPLIPLPSTVCSVCLYTCQSSSSLIVFRFTSKVPSLARAVFYIYCSNCPFLTGVVLNFSSVAVFLSIGHAHPIVIQGFSGLRMYMILYIQLIVFLFFVCPFSHVGLITQGKFPLKLKIDILDSWYQIPPRRRKYPQDEEGKVTRIWEHVCVS